MQIIESTDEDVEELVMLYRAHGFSIHKKDWFHWKYDNNPWGRAKSFKMVHNGKIAGAVAIVPQKYMFRGSTYTGIQAVDGLLGAKIRGKGNFNRLMSFVADQTLAVDQDPTFLIGFVSLNASIKALENSGWQRKDTIKLHSCLLSPKPLLRHKEVPATEKALEIGWRLLRKILLGPIPPSITIQSGCCDDIDFGHLHDQSKIEGVRNRAYLKWRVEDNPKDAIFILSVFEENVWVGYAVFKLIGKTAEIVELKTTSKRKTVLKAVMRYLYEREHVDKIDVFSVSETVNRHFLPRIGFIRRSFNGTFFVNNLKDTGLPEDPCHWNISYLDSDW